MGISKVKSYLVKGLKDRATQAAIIIAVSTAILTAMTFETQISTINPILEETIFDPLCVGEHDLKFERQSFCEKWTWVEPMGVSVNIDAKNTNDNHARTLFLKIDATQIPTSNPLTTTTITKADLILKTRYEPALNGQVSQIPFYTMNQICTDISWSENTEDENLPCINKDNMYPNGEYSTFNPLNPKWIDDVKFDLIPHIKKAKNQGINVFTELIQFYPVQISNDNFNSTTVACVKSKSNENLSYSSLDDCLGFYRISVYSDTNPSEGVRPQLALEYTTKPTPVITVLIAIMAAAIPIVGGVVKAQYQSIADRKQALKDTQDKHQTKMRTICTTLQQEVNEIKNGLSDTKKSPTRKNILLNDFDGNEILNFKLEKEVVFVYVPIDAYSEIINSGSFENFNSASQKSITEFYDYVRVYMEYEKKAEQLLNDLLIKSAETKDIGTIKKPYEKILRVYYKYLGDKRIEIISKCDEVNNLLKLEIDRFS